MSPDKILLIIQGARLTIEWAIEVWQKLAQQGELTPAQRAAFEEEMNTAFMREYWKPRDPS